MAHWFILKPQRWIHPLITVTNQGIVQSSALDQSSSAQLLHLLPEPKGACWSDLIDEALGRELQGELLSPDGRLREIDDANNTKAIGRSCLLYTSPSPRDKRQSRMPSSA